MLSGIESGVLSMGGGCLRGFSPEEESVSSFRNRGRGQLICVALLFFILAGSGIAHASTLPGEDVRIDPTNGEALSVDIENARQTLVDYLVYVRLLWM